MKKVISGIGIQIQIKNNTYLIHLLSLQILVFSFGMTMSGTGKYRIIYFFCAIILLTKNLMKEFFILNDCSSYGSHWLWCIVFLKKSGVHKFWFFDTPGNLEEDITKLNNKLKMKNTCHMLLQQMTWCTYLVTQKCTKHISTWEVPENWQKIILV